MIAIENLHFSYGREKILDGISFQVQKGDFLMVLGKNGIGKTTLFQLMLGFLKPNAGEIYIDKQNIQNFNRRELSRKIAYIPQQHRPIYNYRVLDVVLFGSYNRMSVFSQPGKQEEEKARQLLKEMDIVHLAERGYQNISGGERQLVLIARAIFQQANILIMDEPTSNLDFGNQYRILSLCKRLCSQGMIVMMAIHNPQQAFLYAEKALVLHNASRITMGKVKDVLTEDCLSEIYQVGIRLYHRKEGKKEYTITIPDMD